MLCEKLGGMSWSKSVGDAPRVFVLCKNEGFGGFSGLHVVLDGVGGEPAM